MVAYNFKEQFADDVASGKKRQTIRRSRKRPTRPGDTLQLYTGMRTRKARKLRDDETCTAVEPITVDSDSFGRLRVAIDGREIRGAQLDQLVEADGFARSMDMREFFAKQYGLPFAGEIIKW